MRTKLIVSRIFIALTALCIVSAFAIAALAPLGLTLADGLGRLDDGSTAILQRHLPDAAWHGVILPFLIRPPWLLPIMVAIVSAGIAVSIRRPAGAGSRRR